MIKGFYILKYKKDNQLNNTQTAKHFKLSRNTVTKWIKIYGNSVENHNKQNKYKHIKYFWLQSKEYIYYFCFMKESILTQISELNQGDKIRLYKVIEGFYLIMKQIQLRNKTKRRFQQPIIVLTVSQREHERMVINMVSNVLFVMIVRRIFELVQVL